VQLSSKRFWI